ncbi:MAG: hypothetical protein ACWGOD_04940 [Desulfobulbales bacterium]
MENTNTASLMEKASDHSRSLLFGLLVNCIFSGQANGRCPLSSLRETLTFEEKYDFVMGLSQEEICQALDQHEKCYENECCSQCQPRALAS